LSDIGGGGGGLADGGAGEDVGVDVEVAGEDGADGGVACTDAGGVAAGSSLGGAVGVFGSVGVVGVAGGGDDDRGDSGVVAVDGWADAVMLMESGGVVSSSGSRKTSGVRSPSLEVGDVGCGAVAVVAPPLLLARRAARLPARETANAAFMCLAGYNLVTLDTLGSLCVADVAPALAVVATAAIVGVGLFTPVGAGSWATTAAKDLAAVVSVGAADVAAVVADMAAVVAADVGGVGFCHLSLHATILSLSRAVFLLLAGRFLHLRGTAGLAVVAADGVRILQQKSMFTTPLLFTVSMGAHTPHSIHSSNRARSRDGVRPAAGGALLLGEEGAVVVPVSWCCRVSCC